MTDSYQKPQSSAISELSSVKDTPDDIEAWLRSLPQASRAKNSQLPITKDNTTQIKTSGRKLPAAFAKYNLDSRSWKTFQRSVFGGGILDGYLETWPRSGTMQNGVAYQQQEWAPLTEEIEYGCWPTPTTKYDNHQAPSMRKHPASRRLQDQLGGKPSLGWIEWLMGIPTGWTDLQPLEMNKFQQWLQQHSDFCGREYISES